MALSATQIQQLNALANKSVLTDTDKANLAYAEKQGYKLPTNPTANSVAIPAGQIANYTVTGQTGATGTPGSTLYGIPKTSTITPDSLKTTDPINLGTTETDTTDEAGAMAAGAKATTKTIADYIKELTPAETETSKQADDLTSQINALSQSLVNQGSDQLAAETAQGLPTLKNDLSAVNAEIQTKTAEYDALISGVESKNIGMGNIYRQQSNIAKAKASELGILQARALGLQGQITQAQATADRAIDLKYSAIETQLKVYQAQLSALEGKLTKEEEIQREARQAMLDDQKQAVAEKKEEEKNIQSIALTAIQNGADGALANAIQNAKSLTEAAQIAGQLATSSGWQYVNTPALRDSLIKQGYQITQAGGRTYAKLPEIDYKYENLLLDKAKFASDADYKNAQLQIEMAKLNISQDKPLTITERLALKEKGFEVDVNGDLTKVTAPTEEKVQKANDVITKINELFKTDDWKKAVGPLDSSLPSWMSGKRNTARANIQSIIDSIAIENLALLKGPMSDKDIDFIRNATAGLKTDMSEDGFKTQLDKIKKKFEEIKNKALKETGSTTKDGKTKDDLRAEFPQASNEEIDALFKEEGGFNSVGGDTNKAVSVKSGTTGGQCGRFVNKYTGLGLGDSYQSKIAKMDSSLLYPQPGMVFVMPYGTTGHTGFIQSVNDDGTVTVKDSNWGLDEKVKTHKIAINKITGLARA